MYARIISLHLPDSASAAEILPIHEHLYAELKKMSGFANYLALVNRGTGEAKAIVFWETKHDMEIHRAETARTCSLLGAALGTSPAFAEEYEIAYHSKLPRRPSKISKFTR